MTLVPLALHARGSGDFHALAPTPPMGWNSWDSFATTLNEEQARATAEVFAGACRDAQVDVRS